MSTPRLNRPSTEPLADPMHTTGNGQCHRENREHRVLEYLSLRDKTKTAVRREEKKTKILYTAPFSPEIRSAIERAVPTNSWGPLHRRIFGLARELKGIASLADADAADLGDILTAWYQLAAPMLPDESCADDAMGEFISSWGQDQFPSGTSPLDMAVKKMETTKLPAVAEHFSSPLTQRLIHLCQELQRASGAEPFFLSGVKASEILGCDSRTAWRRLKILTAFKIITVVTPGRGYRATRYRYIASDGEHDDG